MYRAIIPLMLVPLIALAGWQVAPNPNATPGPDGKTDRPLKRLFMPEIERVKEGTPCGDRLVAVIDNTFFYYEVTNEKGVTGIAVCEEVFSITGMGVTKNGYTATATN